MKTIASAPMVPTLTVPTQLCHWIFSMANYNWKTSGDHTIIYACWTYTLPCRWPFWVDKEDLRPIWYRHSQSNGRSGWVIYQQHFSTIQLGMAKMGFIFSEDFNRVPLITKYQHFRFSSSTPGIVYVCTSCSAEEKPIKIFKKKVTAATAKRARLPPVIPPGGLTEERKNYLYEQIRPFVSP